MALSNSQPEEDEVDIVCGALCAKLQAKNLSNGSSRCISFNGKLVNLSAMLGSRHLGIGRHRFAVMGSL